MNIEVRYFTRSGNTKKLAGAIGGAVNTAVKFAVDVMAAEGLLV